MKYIYLLSAFILSCMISGCIEDPEMDTTIKNGGKPEITISGREEFDEVTAQSVTLSGNIVRENGIPVIERGFCWGLENIDENKQVVDKKGKGEFKATISNLKNDEQYIVCAYAITSNGKEMIYYSESVTFSTNTGIGTVKNSTPKNIRATTAFCSGKITYQGEGEIKDQGIYLSSPTVKDSLVHGTLIGTDSITCLLVNLTPETKYSVRAYVENTYGLFSDKEPVTFTTTSGHPTLEGLKKLKVGYTDAEFSAKIVDEGDAPITTCGFCYGTEKLPTIADDTIICKNVNDEFSGVLANLKSQTQYYVRAYATNKYGTSYNTEGAEELITKSNWPTVSTNAITDIENGTAKVGGKVLDIGNSEITITGICWSTNKTPTVNNDSIILSYQRDSTFTGTITGLRGGSTYYVRAFAKNNEKEYAYGREISFTTPPIFKTVASFTGVKRNAGSVGACSLNGTGYLLGGDLGPKYTNELWAFNEDNGWYQRLPFPGGERKWQTVVGNGSSLYALGGVNSSGEAMKDFYIYSVNDNSWSNLGTANGPTFISQVASTTKDNNIYFIGGRGLNSAKKDSLSNEVWTYSIGGGWTKKASFLEEQCGSIAVVINNKIYAGLGVNNLSTLSGSKKLWSSSDAGTWQEEEPVPSSSIIRAGVAYKDCIYVVDDTGKIWKYNPSLKIWSGMSALSSSNRGIHCMYVLNDILYIGLGSASALISYDPVWDN